MIRILVRLVVFVVLFSLLTVGLVWAFGDEKWPRVTSLAELREKKVIHYEHIDLYLSLYEGEVHALADYWLMDGIKKSYVQFCEKSGLFEGEGKFDAAGRYFGGPPPRGLERYPVEIEGGDVLVNLEEPRPGLPRLYGGDEPIGPFCIPV